MIKRLIAGGLILILTGAISLREAYSAAIQQADSKREVKIYLVALGDEGKLGKKFGCDDSLVAVSRQINASNAPLKDTLQELLSIPEEFGQSPQLNNYWKGEHLQVKSAAIKAGVATIHITGQLSVAGVCDEPRIESQIDETARQFPEVKKVIVYINGKLLKQAIR